MLNAETKRKINNARDILVGKIPVPTAQVEQITLALVYKFMSDMDQQAKKLGDTTGFFMGEYEKYAWNNIIDTSLSAYDRVALYSEGLEKMNNNPHIPQLFRDIFKGAFLPFKDPETLKLFLDQINEIEYTHSEDLGDAYEFLLSIMGSQGDAGQFRTPRHIIDFIVEVVDPKKEDRILDPACGTAGFLISAYKHILKQNTLPDSELSGSALSPMDRARLTENFVGYDISHEMRRLSLVNLYLHQFPNPKIYEYDTLTSLEHWDEDFDCILANPPFMTPKGGIRPHNRFSISANRSEVLFVDYIMEHLSNNGKAGIIVPEGIIFQSSNAYKSLRKTLVEDNYLWAVVSLPSGVFQPYSGVKTSILLLDKNIAKKTDNILFVKVENDGFDLGAQRKENGKSDLTRILQNLKTYKDLIKEDKEIPKNLSLGFIVKKNEIQNTDSYNLNSSIYQQELKIESKSIKYLKLNELCSFSNGLWKGKTNKKSLARVIRNANFTKDCKIRTDNVEEILVDNSQLEKRKLKKGDIILEKSGGGPTQPVGRVVYFDIDGDNWSFSNFTSLLRTNNEIILSKYLWYVLKHLYDQGKTIALQTQTTGIRNLDFESYKNIDIPIIELEKQKKIVEELDRYQKIIDGAQMIIDNWDLNLEISSKYKSVKLKEIATVTSSKRIYQSEYTEKGIPFYRSKEIIELSQGKEITTKLYINEPKYNNIREKFGVPINGEILVTAVGTIGDVYVIDLPYPFYFKDGNILWVKNINNEYNPNFLGYILENQIKRNIGKLANGGAYNAITIEKVKEIEIPFVPLKEQIELAKTIDTRKKHLMVTKDIIEIAKEKQRFFLQSIYEQ